MIVFPDPVKQVTIPEIFSVSQIVSADDCFLKVLLASQCYDIERLRPPPSAELGKVFHSLVEEVTKGFFNLEDATIEYLETLLDHLLDECRKKLEQNPHTISYADLTRTMTPLAWARKRRLFIDTAFDFINNSRHVKKTTRGGRKGSFSFEDARGNGRWVEVPICVPVLRLKGRIDVLERTGDEIKIIDLKSGCVVDADGHIKPKITLQLLLYGLLAQYLDPKAHLSLIVNDGMEHPILFDSKIMEETESRLISMMSSFVSGEIVPAERHAKLCLDCSWCGIRHRCLRYLREVPGLWTREIEWRLPLDTWGTVERFVTNDNGLLDLTLLDEGGRRIKVFRVRETHLTKLAIGKRVWLFDLAASQTALDGNYWKHPLNFHEINEFDPTDRAWSLQVFFERS